MVREKIKEIVSKEAYNPEYLYLIKLISPDSAFLYCNGIVYFAVKSNNSQGDSIDTNVLSLKSNISKNTVENNPSFIPGCYDLLIFKGDVESDLFDSFIELCEAYVINNTAMNLVDFFYALLSMFQMPKEQSFVNLIGCFGELIVIKEFYEKFNLNICSNWHSGDDTFDKYDFSFNELNMEVKSTIKDNLIFKIKHSQIFNDKNNYVMVVNLESDNSGFSMKDLYNYFKKNNDFANNLGFMIKLEKEKKKFSMNDFNEKKLNLLNYHIYCNKDLETIKNIPQCINLVEYYYDFIGQKEIEIETFINSI